MDKNWVDARADCTPELTCQALVKIVQGDIQRFNNLPSEKRGDRTFRCREDGDNWIVERTRSVLQGGQTIYDLDPEHKDYQIRIGLSDGMIVAERPGVTRLEIEPRWNEETLVCDLYIDDRAFPVWHVSQKILREFMFGR